MKLFYGLFENGVWIGLIYAVLAVTFGMIMRTARVFHLAHGAVYATAAFLLLQAQKWSSGAGKEGTLPFIAGLVVVALLVGLLGVAINEVVYHRLTARGSGALALIVGSLAATYLIEGVLGIFFGSEQTSLAPPAPRHPLTLGPFTVSPVQTWGIPALIVLLGLLWVWYSRSSVGRMARAVGSNRSFAQVCGISPRLLGNLIMFVASGVLVFPAMFFGASSGLSTTMGDVPVLFAILSVVLGGLDKFWGWMTAGILLGVIESLATKYVGTTWTESFTFALVMVFMMLRPNGIAGTRLRYL